jgi:hypothetical protein
MYSLNVISALNLSKRERGEEREEREGDRGREIQETEE